MCLSRPQRCCVCWTLGCNSSHCTLPTKPFGDHDVQEAGSDDENEEDLTVTHKKHLRFFGVRWKYLRVFLAFMWCLCFVAAGIVLKRKVPSVVSCVRACSLICLLMFDCMHWAACAIHVSLTL